MSVVNVHEARTQLSRLLAWAEAGEQVVIAPNGIPIARLVRYENGPGIRPFGAMKGQSNTVHRGERAGRLPGPHPDPFDRMLIARLWLRTSRSCQSRRCLTGMASTASDFGMSPVIHLEPGTVPWETSQLADTWLKA